MGLRPHSFYIMRETIKKSQAMKDWNDGEGCTRQRIHQLIVEGRLTKPVDGSGKVIRGCLYLDEVVSFKKLQRGRPRLPEDVVNERHAAKILKDKLRLEQLMKQQNRIPDSGILLRSDLI